MYASRAGDKLAGALTHFNVVPNKMVCADLGCSTGGFTDCLLQGGASRVYSVDTGYGVLAYKLRTDPRVVVLERTNALHVNLPEKVDLITIDVSWTPQRLIVPHALSLLCPGGQIMSLIKPHYESKNPHPTPEQSFIAASQVRTQLSQLVAYVSDLYLSPLIGEKGGNTEYFVHLRI